MNNVVSLHHAKTARRLAVIIRNLRASGQYSQTQLEAAMDVINDGNDPLPAAKLKVLTSW